MTRQEFIDMYELGGTYDLANALVTMFNPTVDDEEQDYIREELPYDVIDMLRSFYYLSNDGTPSARRNIHASNMAMWIADSIQDLL